MKKYKLTEEDLEFKDVFVTHRIDCEKEISSIPFKKLIEIYGEDAYLNVEYDYGGADIFICYKRKETNEERALRIERLKKEIDKNIKNVTIRKAKIKAELEKLDELEKSI